MSSIKALKRISKLATSDKDRLKRAYTTAVSGLETVLNIVNGAAGSVGPPGLQAGIGGLLFILGVIKTTSQNVQDMEQLVKNINDLTTVLQNSQDRGTLSEEIIRRIDHLSTKWSSIADQVRQTASRHVIKRFIHYSDDAQSINDHIKTINWSIQSFTVETMLAIEFSFDEQKYTALRIEAKLENVGEKMDAGFQQLNAKLDVKDGHPPHAIFARFDSKARSRCLEGTRDSILNRIYGWIDVEGLPLDDVTVVNLPILWINGSGGTGKTTIAYTVAEACRTRGILGASFFCSRDNAECSNPNLIFPTLAYQLGQFFPPFSLEVTQALKSNPDIGYSDPAYQLEQLIIKPLQSVVSFPPCVVVLDALDECKDSGVTSVILTALSRHITEIGPLKILITSRPERNITRAFFSTQLNPAAHRLVLHEVELDVVQHDIERYLTANLAGIREAYELESSWPSMADIHALAHLSVGLFIFAATSIKFIEDRNYCDPRGQLADLLRNTAEVAKNPSSPHHHLDQLYMEVLTHAFPDISPRLANRLKMILGTIILLRDHISPVALEQLLNLKAGTVRETLLHLHSVVIVPGDDGQVIRLHHPSFYDFMTNATRCPNPKFVVNAKTQHTLLARTCLVSLKNLRRDICEVKDSSILNSEVDDLPARITRRIPPHLQYACRHWAFHLSNSMLSDVLLDLMKEFCSKYLLYWVEVCSLLGELRSALLALQAAQRALAAIGENTADVVALLHDCERFTREFFQVLSISSLQVYHSALLFTPEQTLIHKTYGHELVLPMKVYNASEKTWNLCIRTMDGHSKYVDSVAFSSDGARVVSGSRDNTLRLWDTVSGAHLNTLTGHTDYVRSVAFSPDGTRVVSGSGDKTLRLWDATSGEVLNTLAGHSDPVGSVAFSPDGTRVVSGSDDRTLRLWDATSCAHLHTLTGHTEHIGSVAFSPDGTRVVSGSWDKTLRLWDAASGVHLQTLTGHTEQIGSAAFSPDGTRIISGSWDKTLRLWDAVSGKHLKTLMGHSDFVRSATFSSDGARIVSGSDDKTLRLWDAVSGTHLNTFTGHSDYVRSVAFSPDGTRVVSGSDDKTVRLWEAVSGGLNTGMEQRSPVTLVGFSPDGTRVVSAQDTTLRLWNAMDGAHLHTLVGHPDYVDSVTFSPDGTRVISGSHDKTFWLWDAFSGVHLDTLIGHPESATSFARTLVDTPNAYRMEDDEWIYLVSEKRRLCWIPVSCRPAGVLAWSKGRVALGTHDGRVVIIHLS